MRKHHTRWVALFSAAAISTSGLTGLAGPAAADDKDTEAFDWPVVRQGVSTYSLDGYELTYLPPGLENYGVNASSTTDRQGNSQSQISWVQGPDQLYGRIAVLRSDSLQDLDDLRAGRYSHLADGSLEELEDNEAFEDGAYLSAETGDLFWMERPGVAVATHLQPDRWEDGELLKMAESVSAEVSADEDPEAEEAEAEETDGAGDAEGTDEAETDSEGAEDSEDADADGPEVGEEAEGDEAEGSEDTEGSEDAEDAEETDDPATEEDDADAVEDGTEDESVDEGADEGTVEDPADLVEETPVDEAPVDEEATDEAPDEDVVDEDVVDSEGVDEEAPSDDAPEEETPTDEAPVEDAPEEETPAEDAPEEVEPPVEADLPDGLSSREVKTCLTEHFVEFGSGQTDLNHEQMTPTSAKFVERALAQDGLGDADRDRLLATVWYYGNENDKVAATNDCARSFGLERSEVEDVLDEVAHLIGELVQEANETVANSMDEAQQAIDAAELPEDGTVEIEDPVDAEEWEELWESLPWSLPAETQ